MNPRTTQILEALIQEFIVSGEPVSSKQLAKRRDFEVRDATIRNELNYLMQEGYLEQPHISSGRIPTDKGYRFLVNLVMSDFSQINEREFTPTVSELEDEFISGKFDNFIRDLADNLELLSAGYNAPAELVYKSGLDGLFENMVSDAWFNNPHELFRVVQDFELLDDRMEELLNFLSPSREPRVFIGRSPITRSPQLSVIAERFVSGDGDFVIAAIGPKRMDYGRTIRFFRVLRQAINT